MGGLGVKVQHFPLTLLVDLTTLTLPCERERGQGIHTARRTTPRGADGAQTEAALLRRTARSVNATFVT